MIRRPPRSTQDRTLFPYTTLFRSTPALRVVLRSAGPQRKRFRAALSHAHLTHVLFEVLAGVSERDLRVAGRAGDGIVEPRDRGPRYRGRAAYPPRRDHRRGERGGADRGRDHLLDPAQRHAAARQLRPRVRLPASLSVLRRALVVHQLKLT